jgi:hypothetical protein
LGPNAKKFLNEGGFKKYYQTIKRQELAKQAALWSPILISLLALFISIFSWLMPAHQKSEVNEMQKKVDSLKQKQIELNNKLDSQLLKAYPIQNKN